MAISYYTCEIIIIIKAEIHTKIKEYHDIVLKITITFINNYDIKVSLSVLSSLHWFSIDNLEANLSVSVSFPKTPWDCIN